MTRISRFSGLAAMVAATSMVSMPAAAADVQGNLSGVTMPVYAAWDADSENAAAHRRYRGYRDRTSVGDVLAGVLIIGTVAAVANAATRSGRDGGYRGQPYPSRPYPGRPYPDRPYDYRADRNDDRGYDRYNDSRGIDRAVDMCVRQIERDVRVRGVDEVERSGDGWRVSGTLYNGDEFTCTLGADGRVGDINYAGRKMGRNDQIDERRDQTGQADDRQWSDDRYATAWNTAPQRAANAPAGNLPAYPGGPVVGSDQYGADAGADIYGGADNDPGDGYVDGDAGDNGYAGGTGDGRYGTSGVEG